MIKVETSLVANKAKSYPYLGQCKKKNVFDAAHSIVFFTGKDTGVSLNTTSTSELGEYSELWDEDQYEVMSGTVTISNA